MLAATSGSLNIAQGFPDFNTLAITKDNLAKVADLRFEECVKKSPYQGNLDFRKKMANLHKKRLQNGLEFLRQEKFEDTFLKYGIDPKTVKFEHDLDESNVAVCTGGQGTHAAFTSTFLQEGDEAILFQPMFLWYPHLENIGVEAKFTSLVYNQESKTYRVNFDELRSLINPKTKLITMINPNNPNGKCFTLEELLQLRQICLENP